MIAAALLGVPLLLRDSFAEELLRGIEEAWTRVAGATLESQPYRDKARFSSLYAEAKEERSPSPKDLDATLRAFAALEKEHGSDPSFRWRADDLAGSILWDLGRKEEAMRRLRAALDGYPQESYAEPSKHGSFQHLANETAGRIWESEGVEAAEAFALARFREDRRFVYFYTPWWEERYAKEGESRRIEGLLRSILETYREKAKADPTNRTLLERYAEELASAPRPEERRVGDDPKKTYFLLGNPKEKGGPPRGLVLVMPGGSGQARDFLPFLANLQAALGEGFVLAALSAPQWNPEQAKTVVWPTERSRKRFREAAFSTESFLRSVLEDVKAQAGFEISKAFVLAWSSGGPAAYAASTEKDAPYGGYYVLSSVFLRGDLDLDHVRGRRFYLQQGTQDRITALHHAQAAEKALAKKGAIVKLDVFEGGHGFDQPGGFEAVRTALEWLESGR